MRSAARGRPIARYTSRSARSVDGSLGSDVSDFELMRRRAEAERASQRTQPAEEASAPPYEIPDVGEEIRVYDATRWGKTVPAVYVGWERVADDFFMHNVRTADGLESIASHNVYRRHGDGWETLTPKPRYR